VASAWSYCALERFLLTGRGLCNKEYAGAEEAGEADAAAEDDAAADAAAAAEASVGRANAADEGTPAEVGGSTGPVRAVEKAAAGTCRWGERAL
jgi:hypothetical protein